MKTDGIGFELSSFQQNLIKSMVGGVAPPVPHKKREIKFDLADPFVGAEGKILTKDEVEAYDKSMAAAHPLVKSVLNTLNGGRGDSIERLSFETRPGINNEYGGLWRRKLRLLPDEILKRIAIQDDLVAAIANTRSNQVAAFGRPQPDRFSTGVRIEPEPKYTDKLKPDEKEKLQKRISEVEALLLSCGETKGIRDQTELSLGQYLFMVARNAVIFGRLATELIWMDLPNGEKRLHSFRPIDAGTIYRAAPYKDGQDSVRKEALHLLEQLRNKKLEPERTENEEYAWVQVIDGAPKQVFTSDECACYNFYPVADVELDGYPVSPLDTVISAVMTHINITTHNKLYFQSGRASRGMIVIKSEDVDENIVGFVRQQFNASINSVGNAWRMPIFGVGPNEEIGWYPIDNSSRDMEFQYLSDTNARVILSAFQMSPEELPGYSHLSRGTNNQALSECFQPLSLMWTDKGLVSAADLLGSEDEVKTRVWTGTEFVDARLFRTGEKGLRETVAGGLSLKTSPDHRFRVLDTSGELIWRRQEELSVGDLLVVNAKPVPGDEALVPSFNGKKLTPEMMEILGWMTGDGTLKTSKERDGGGYMKLFYHHEKERDVWENHAKVLTDFGFDVKHHEKVVSETEAEALKERYGFKSIADTRITNVIYSADFVRGLLDFGFNDFADGKNVPALLHVLPVEYRRAFLKGLFSADGHVTKQGAVVLTIQADSTREQVRQMLMGLGVRTLACKGQVRDSFGEKTLEKQLFIKDKQEFWETIGFIQPHKQERRRDQKWSVGAVPGTLATKLLEPVFKSEMFCGWDKKTRDNLRSVAKASGRTISWDKMHDVLVKSLGSAPAWMSDYHVEPVTELAVFGQRVQMVDVEVFDSNHAQILQGLCVHNSNNEYKLEAHRDVGIRPLLAHFQNFLNSKIFPLLAPDLAKFCSIKFVGLDVDTAEKESTRLQQDMAVHMTTDEVLEKVEKKPVGRKYGGEFLLNPQWQAVIDKYMTVGQILEQFFDQPGASKDPQFAYVRDQFWFSWQQLQQQQQLQQMQAQQPQGAPPGGGGGGQPPQDSQQPQGDGDQQQPDQGQGQDPNAQQEPPQDLTRSIDQLAGTLSKNESKLPWSKRTLLRHHRDLVSKVLKGFEEDAEQASKEIVGVVESHLPAKFKE
jgi:LAGLIDADG-like domain